MHRFSIARLSVVALLAIAALIPANLVPAGQARAASGAVVTMYAGGFTPYGGKISPQHQHVVTALKVLADQFQKQTGIQIQFINPAIGTGTGNNYPDWNRYMQSAIAGGTAPDVVDAPQGIGISQLGWFQDMTSYLAQPNPFVAGNKHWKDQYSDLMLTYPEGNGGVLASDKRYYEIPIQANYPYIVIGTFYNKNLLAKAGITEPPTTWEQWMQQLSKLRAAGVTAGMAPNTGENKSGSVWPLWSTLCAPFTENLALKLDPKDKGVMSNLTESQFIVSGAIAMKDPRMQAPWIQYKRQAGYYLPGWNSADIQAAWTQGKLAERYAGFWEIPTQKSNTAIKYKWGFFAPVPVTSATSPLADGKYTWVPTGEAARIAKAGYSDGFGVVANSVKKDNNLAAVVKWLQFITAPQADEFIVDENVTGVPVVTGAHMAPSYNVLNSAPVPYYQAEIFPYQMYNAEFAAVTHESVIWLLDQENDTTFFTHMQNIIMQYARQTIADNAKKK